MYVIRPFRAQGAEELNAALLLMRFRPVLTLVCVGIAILVATLAWRGVASKAGKAALALAVFVTCGAAVAARINVFEIMFHPIPEPQFEAAIEGRLDDDDMVLAIQQNGVARGYPVRAIAYHHIVNDNVGSVPIVATY